MLIALTQTLLGQDGRIAADRRMHVRAVALAGRLAGLLAAVMLFAMLLMLTPMEAGSGLRIEPFVAFSGLLVLQVVAFALLRRAAWLACAALPPMGGLAVLLVSELGAPVAVMVCVALAAISDYAATRLLFRSRRSAARRWLAGGLGAILAGLMFAVPHLLLMLWLIGLAVPALATWLLLPSDAPAEVAEAEMLPAVDHGRDLLVDAAGAVVGPEPRGASLVDALLVVDRPALLHALSRAIHQGEANDRLVARLRREGAGGAHFVAHEIAVAPMPGRPGLARVRLRGQAEAPVSPLGAPRAGADPALLQRAMHDAVAPFNAGLGYLELIADPRLAPRDLAGYRHYAAEARDAMLDAHRNAALMGRWLRLTMGPTETGRERLDCLRLAQDAARFTLAAEACEGRLRVVGEPGEIMAYMPGDAARFAIGVLLRAALLDHPGRILELAIMRKGPDIRVEIRPEDGAQPVAARDDMLQMALEQAAAAASHACFTIERSHRCLTFAGVSTRMGNVASQRMAS